MRETWRAARPWTVASALAVLLGVATVLSGVGLLATSAYLVSSAALRPPFGALGLAVVGVRFFGLARGFFRYGERLASHSVNLGLVARLRMWFYQVLEPLAPARLIQQRSGDLLARGVADLETLQELFVRVLAPPATAVVVGIAMMALFGGLDPSLGALIAIAFAAGGIAVPALTRWWSRRAGPELVQAQAAMQTHLVEGIQGIADLTAFGQQGAFLATVESVAGQLSRAQARMNWAAAGQAGMTALAANAAMAAALWVSIDLVDDGRLAGVLLAAVTLGTLAAMEAVAPLPEAALAWDAARTAEARLREIARLEPAVRDPSHPVDLPNHRPLAVSIRSVRFSYEADGPRILDDLDLDVAGGSRVAVVGPSGAGKSTLLGLLLRFWDYDGGEIRLGGVELRACAQDDVRQRIAVIPQRVYLFAASLRENLMVANPQASPKQLDDAVRRAQLEEFVRGLPDGLDTWIGERGLRLSGGERQRVAVARALLRDAPVLLLDEPTAHLDALTERLLVESLDQAMQGRTAIVLTHRLVGMEAMNQIAVLDRGRITERGTHGELLAAGGRYRAMWDLQNGMLAG